MLIFLKLVEVKFLCHRRTAEEEVSIIFYSTLTTFAHRALNHQAASFVHRKFGKETNKLPNDFFKS